MNAIEFERPVLIVSGVGMPVWISTVAQAYTLLDEWPVARRNAAHKLAIDACRAALRGDIGSDLACAAFKGFAKRQDILVEPLEADPADASWQAAPQLVAAAHGSSASLGAQAM